MKYLIKLLLFTILLSACSPTPPTTVDVSPTSTVLVFPPHLAAEATTSPSVNPTAKPKQSKASPTPVPVSSDFIADAILGRPTDTSITVNLVPAVDMEIYYEYGLQPGVYTAQTAPQTAQAGQPLETLINGLQSDRRYYYRLRYSTTAGPERSFVTQRAPGSVFSFAVQGDSHPERVKNQFDPDLYIRTLLAAAAEQPDFYIDHWR